MQRVVGGGGGGGGGGLSNHPAIASPLGPYSTASDTSADDMAAGGTLSHTLSHAPTFGINLDPFVTPCYALHPPPTPCVCLARLCDLSQPMLIWGLSSDVVSKLGLQAR